MAEIHSPLPVKLFVGVLTSIPDIISPVEEQLSELFGPIDARSEPFPFDMTRYYDETMGSPISRRFIGFSNLIEPSVISDIKKATNELESVFASKWTTVQRPINLDPGYLEQSKIVLASTKNFYHRILVSDGIYAEVTLHFEAGEWRTFPWTFPDFKMGRYHPFFSTLRDTYRTQLSDLGVRIRSRWFEIGVGIGIGVGFYAGGLLMSKRFELPDT
jgi:hypothetical protein